MWKDANELFALVDDARGGRVQVFKRKLKLGLRHAWFKNELDQLKHYFDSKQLMDLLKTDPSLHLKCTRSYLWTGLNGNRRLMAQLSFYDWLLSQYDLAHIQHFYKRHHTTIGSFTIKDRVMEVRLCPSRGLGREGELALFLCLDGKVLMKASFTVLPLDWLGLSGSGHAMFVGAFQGEKDSLALFKEATQLMERTKPAHLIFSALQGLAQIWNLQAILGVSDQLHAFSGYKTTLAKRVKTNYDDVWQELGGEQSTQHPHWVLPLTWVPRPESEIESKKRSAYRRRTALRQAFLQACTSLSAKHLITEQR